jgi:hypothetical protein
MGDDSAPLRFLAHEARSLLSRLDRVKAYSLNMPMVPAAAITPAAQTAIERCLASGRQTLREMIYNYLRRLGNGGKTLSAPEAQQKFAILKMRFNNMLSQFDIFADVLNQRSEHETGIWISGLDAAAADALKISGDYYEVPPVICYIDRGHGAAIRRARTRLPDGMENPVAIIRVPRERMIGSGIASSLVHEVGHQGSALLDLVNLIRPVLHSLQKRSHRLKTAWLYWERWISEILADFWSVAKLGITATLGLIGVVSLPKAFVFRILLDDPHPFPWIRVKISCAIGNALYPHPQWARLSRLWESLYPLNGLAEIKKEFISLLLTSLPEFISLLVNHRPKSLRGKSLKEVFTLDDRQPSQLQSCYKAWKYAPEKMMTAQPTLLFAVVGQAKVDCRITPEQESMTLSGILINWALKGSLNILGNILT